MKVQSKYGESLLKNLKFVHEGKVRTTYETLHPEYLLVVASDRLSTHDVVHTSRVPLKGQVLTAITIQWLAGPLQDAHIPHHLIAYGRHIYSYLPGKPIDYPPDLHLRAMIVLKLKMIPIEFIWRSHLCGSLYDKFYSQGKKNPYEVELPPGMRLMEKFPEPIFTPTEKGEKEDPPLVSAKVAREYPEATKLTRKIFDITRDHLHDRGITEVDYKGEVGLDVDGNVCVADEIATPDCCRFTKTSEIVIGTQPTWYDKQIARDAAVKMWGGGEKVPLNFEPEIINDLTEVYAKMCKRITGLSIQRFQFERL